jgi:hypothetical protein
MFALRHDYHYAVQNCLVNTVSCVVLQCEHYLLSTVLCRCEQSVQVNSCRFSYFYMNLLHSHRLNHLLAYQTEAVGAITVEGTSDGGPDNMAEEETEREEAEKGHLSNDDNDDEELLDRGGGDGEEEEEGEGEQMQTHRSTGQSAEGLIAEYCLDGDCDLYCGLCAY